MYLSSWIHPAVHSIIAVFKHHNTEKDTKKITEIFQNNVTPEMVNESLKLLTEINLIEFKNGYFQPTSKHLRFNYNTKDSELLYKYQKKWLEVGITLSSVTKNRGAYRLSTSSLFCSRSVMKEIREDVDALQKFIMEKVKNDENATDSVYQVNFHIFELYHEETE